MPFVEPIKTPELTYDRFSGTRGARYFRAWGGVNRETVITQPATISAVDSTGAQTFLPDYDSEWPGIERLTLDSYTSLTDGTITEIRASYSDRRLVTRKALSFQSDKAIIPVAVRMGAVYAIASGQSSADQRRGYVIQYQTIPTRLTRFQVICYYDLMEGENEFEDITLPIQKQVTKLHQLIVGAVGESSAMWALFEGGDARLQSDRSYEIRYSWSIDPGVPHPDPNGDGLANGVLPTFGPDADGKPRMLWPRGLTSHIGISAPNGNGVTGWLKPPFEEVVVVPGTAQIIQGVYDVNPVFDSWCGYDFGNRLGWQALPGMII